MKRAYRFCLQLYPRHYRDRFADEMAGVFEEACGDGRNRGWAWHVRFAFAEVAGLIGGAAGVWLDRHIEPEIPAASAPPNELMETQKRIDASIAGMVDAIAHHQFARARLLSNQERVARENLRLLREKHGISG